MEDEEKDLIRRNYVDLAKLLKSEIELIIKTLYSNRIISEDMADRILEVSCLNGFNFTFMKSMFFNQITV